MILISLYLLLLPRAQSTAPTCFQDPSQPKCTDISALYTPTMVQQDLDKLCKMMSAASGCLVRQACQTTPRGATGVPCQPWTTLADICSSKGGAAMGGMAGCTHYQQLCDNNSTVVAQCATPATPSLVLSAVAKTSTTEMCTGGMGGMNGCQDCTAQTCPRPLTSLSEACLSMPGMSECTSSGWSTMCGSSNDGVTTLPQFCNPEFNTTTDQCNAAGMKMYFHGGIHDMVLFKSWYACNVGQYLLVLWVTFMVSFLSGSFRSRRKKVETCLYDTCCGGGGGGGTNAGRPGRSGSNLDASLLHTRRSTSSGRSPVYMVKIGVNGMTCVACTNTVRTALAQGLKGAVKKLTVSLDDGGCAEVHLESPLPAVTELTNIAVEGIEDVGFEVRGTSKPVPSLSVEQNMASNPYPKNAVKAVTTGLQLTIDYALMLAAMSFNTGVFLAVVCGYSTSKFFFGGERTVVWWSCWRCNGIVRLTVFVVAVAALPWHRYIVVWAYQK